MVLSGLEASKFVEVGEAVFCPVGGAGDYADEVDERFGAQGGAHGDTKNGVVVVLGVVDHMPCSEFEIGVFSKEKIGSAGVERPFTAEGDRGDGAHLDAHELACDGVDVDLLGAVTSELDKHDDVAALGLNAVVDAHLIECIDDALIEGCNLTRFLVVFGLWASVVHLSGGEVWGNKT